ncbi:ATP synthase F1 subunit gamma [Candidatus Uhrbacteria bacterium]|nr:ATP synthase F1 subunit gamma [Candidatus Uhrbacteria bacterium]
MAVQTRAIKRRIKSVTNTRKITKAMELVAASKMRKAVGAVSASRPYSKLAWETVISVGGKVEATLHPLMRQSEKVDRVLLLLLSSDRGLAGGYNTNIIKTALAEIRRLGENVEIQTVCIGKRGADAMRRAKQPIMASFTEITNNPKFEEILPIGKMVIDEFSGEKYDKVLLAYTDFVSAISQKPLVLELLPIGGPEKTEEVGSIGENPEPKTQNLKPNLQPPTFEPTPKEVLNKILPRLVETMVYQAVLEAAASEHSSRMFAMRSASDNAAEMIDDLSFTFNQARQAGITQEIAEISSGKAALER